MRRLGLPASLWWFVFTAVVFALQAFPFTGIFLMFAMAPFWSALTINFGFLSLAIEALNGHANRFWLAAPIAWFGVYAAATIWSHVAIRELEQSFTQANATQHFPFDEHNQTIVFPSQGENLNNAASDLVENYDISVAYQELRNEKAARYRAYRLVPSDLCNKVHDNKVYRQAGVRIWPARYNSPSNTWRRNSLEGVCTLTMPEEPQFEPLVVSVESKEGGNFVLPYRLVTITVEEGTRSIKLLSGRASPLAWLPLPVMGCFLNDSTSSWNCTAQFWRTSVDIPKPQQDSSTSVSAVAAALGLKYAPARTRVEAVKSANLPDLGNVVEDSIKRAAATLDDIIAHPTQRLIESEVRGLEDRPDLIAPRAEQMGEAILATLDSEDGSRETARVLETLLVTLPAEKFDSVARVLLANFKQWQHFSYEMVSDAFVARVGDFGKEALPLLTRVAFHSGGFRRPAALVGLCRAGQIAAPFADSINAILTSTYRGDDAHEPAFVALLRIGRRDLAAIDPHSSEGFHKTRYESALATITPESPPSVCDTMRLFPNSQ